MGRQALLADAADTAATIAPHRADTARLEAITARLSVSGESLARIPLPTRQTLQPPSRRTALTPPDQTQCERRESGADSTAVWGDRRYSRSDAADTAATIAPHRADTARLEAITARLSVSGESLAQIPLPYGETGATRDTAATIAPHRADTARLEAITARLSVSGESLARIPLPYGETGATRGRTRQTLQPPSRRTALTPPDQTQCERRESGADSTAVWGDMRYSRSDAADTAATIAPHRADTARLEAITARLSVSGESLVQIPLPYGETGATRDTAATIAPHRADTARLEAITARLSVSGESLVQIPLPYGETGATRGRLVSGNLQGQDPLVDPVPDPTKDTAPISPSA
ncbi:hypothetical protein J6590_066818 [Homalodisca vitripennis]|nr:hypothetical protein J6590_066818 [Homalodisca vitripennis]